MRLQKLPQFSDPPETQVGGGRYPPANDTLSTFATFLPQGVNKASVLR